MRLIVYDEKGPLGTITYENGQLTGSTSGLQAVVDHKVKVAGSAEAAFEMLHNHFNGYIHFKPEDQPGGSIWDRS